MYAPFFYDKFLQNSRARMSSIRRKGSDYLGLHLGTTKIGRNTGEYGNHRRLLLLPKCITSYMTCSISTREVYYMTTCR